MITLIWFTLLFPFDFDLLIYTLPRSRWIADSAFRCYIAGTLFVDLVTGYTRCPPYVPIPRLLHTFCSNPVSPLPRLRWLVVDLPGGGRCGCWLLLLFDLQLPHVGGGCRLILTILRLPTFITGCLRLIR